MAKKFKDYYDAECALLIASRLVEVLGAGGFERNGFVAEISARLEEGPPFSARQDIFAGALERHLPSDYSTAVESLTAILGPPLQQPEGMFTHGWWLWPSVGCDQGVGSGTHRFRRCPRRWRNGRL
ncbi:MAG: hypothetical protein PF508_14155 [Spirochaeta sp.]|nr:hypothetical protein [Spirochaeta sp.]